MCSCTCQSVYTISLKVVVFYSSLLNTIILLMLLLFCLCCKKKEVITATVEANRFSQNARKPFIPKCHHTQTHTQCLPIFRVTQSIFFSIANTKKNTFIVSWGCKYIFTLFELKWMKNKCAAGWFQFREREEKKRKNDDIQKLL